MPRSVITLSLSLTFFCLRSAAAPDFYLTPPNFFYLMHLRAGSHPNSTGLKSEEFMDSAFPRGNEVCRPKVKGRLIHDAQLMSKDHTHSKGLTHPAQTGSAGSKLSCHCHLPLLPTTLFSSAEAFNHWGCPHPSLYKTLPD